MKYYGSHNCPDCVNFKGYLDANQIPYEFIDINASMANLKAFLRLRDQNELFDEVRQSGSSEFPASLMKIGSPWTMRHGSRKRELKSHLKPKQSAVLTAKAAEPGNIPVFFFTT